MNFNLALVGVISLTFITGCASVTGTTGQGVSVETRSAEGAVAGATCEMSNSKGKWFVTTPGSAQIRRSNDDLIVICQRAGYASAQTKVVSETKGTMFGNILIGGGIGAIVDHNTGAAYEYPTLITVQLVRDTSRQGSSPTDSGGSLSPSAAIERCTQLGLKSGTEDFARCVVRLSKQ